MIIHVPLILFLIFQPAKKKKSGKKGKKGKKSGKAKTPTVIDGISTEEMSKEQVCEYTTITTTILSFILLLAF